VGTSETHSEFVLFLDGDMAPLGGWLPDAVKILQHQPDIAAVFGSRIDLPLESDLEPASVDVRACGYDYSEVRHGGGAGLYRRSVLEAVGGFNPCLISDEEPELCLRIRRRAGCHVVRLHRPIVLHFTHDPADVWSIVLRSRRNLYLGFGQNLRQLAGTDLFLPYVAERGFGLPIIAWALAGTASVVLDIAQRRPRATVAWLAASAGVFGAVALKRRSPVAAAHSVFNRSAIAVGTVRGLLKASCDGADLEPRRLVDD
jgi:hypothetical protein